MVERFFNTIRDPVSADLKERASKFIGYGFPLNDLDDWQKNLRSVQEAHPKATHHCYAYRCGQGGAMYRLNDDGEPAGSAGRPILGQIDSLSLNYVIVIIVRYYGGTKLGVPGLIQAYKETAKLTLSCATIITRYYMHEAMIKVPYIQVPELMNLGKMYGWEVSDQLYLAEYQEIFFRIRSGNWDDFERAAHIKLGGIYPDEWDKGLKSKDLELKIVKKDA